MEGKVKLTGEQAKEFTDRIEQQALKRIRNGALVSEADFYAGAAITIHHLFSENDEQLADIIPPMWILGIMSGRSPSTRWEENEEIQKNQNYLLERQARLCRNAELMYELVTDLYECKDRDQYESGYPGSTPSQILSRMMVLAGTVLEDIGLYDFWSEEEEDEQE